MTHWLVHVLGLDNGAGGWYLFWSGVGANFGEIAVITAGIALYRRHNCHVQHCWRIQRHTVNGTPYVVCRHHHPAIDGPISAADVADAHRDAGGTL